MICGSPITRDSKNIVFPISFQSTICGVAFSQSGSASATIGRICFAAVPTIAGMSIAVSSSTVAQGAFYIAFGY